MPLLGNLQHPIVFLDFLVHVFLVILNCPESPNQWHFSYSSSLAVFCLFVCFQLRGVENTETLLCVGQSEWFVLWIKCASQQNRGLQSSERYAWLYLSPYLRKWGAVIWLHNGQLLYARSQFLYAFIWLAKDVRTVSYCEEELWMNNSGLE